MAGRNTATSGRAACLVLCALGIGCTLVARCHRHASCSIFWISRVALQALADALMVGRSADRVGRTVEQRADSGALKDAKGIGGTHLVGTTLVVAGT